MPDWKGREVISRCFWLCDGVALMVPVKFNAFAEQGNFAIPKQKDSEQQEAAASPKPDTPASHVQGPDDLSPHASLDC